MRAVEFTSQSPDETKQWGKLLAKRFKKGDIVCLFGDLGSGKTTLIKGIAEGLKIDPLKVHSPTFVLMNAYKGKVELFHFDFYRLDNVEEINLIGYDEFLYGDGVSVIEWADRLGKFLPEEYLNITLKHKSLSVRRIQLCPHGRRYETLLAGIK